FLTPAAQNTTPSTKKALRLRRRAPFPATCFTPGGTLHSLRRAPPPAAPPPPKMAPGRKAATKPSTRHPPVEAPLTEYERERMETMMRNSRVFRSLGLQEASNILKKSRAKATDATREDSGSLYQPGDGE
ncbi:unnamed protein product, partial [Urochloa humidicola]